MTAQRTEYEQYGREGYFLCWYCEESDGYVVIHPAHGRNEWIENQSIGKLLATKGEAVILLPNREGRRSPDAWRNGEEWEFKTVFSEQVSQVLQKALRRGKTQSSNVLCFIRTSHFQLHELTLAIYSAVKFDHKQQLQKMTILFPNGRLVEISREEVRTSAFMQKFGL